MSIDNPKQQYLKLYWSGQLKLITRVTIFLIFLIVKVSTKQDDNHQMLDGKQNDQTMNFQKLFPFISLQQTINAFPYLKKNIKATILSQLVQDKGCQEQLFSPNSTIKYVILNNKVTAIYSQNIPMQKEDLRIRIQIFRNYLARITQKYRIPDLYMILHMRDKLKFKDIKKQKRKICQALPIFVFNKNTSDYSFDRNKFLIPDIYVIKDGWSDTLKRVKQAGQKSKWQNKVSKALFRGAPSSPYFDLCEYQARSDIFKYYHRAAYVLLSFQFPEQIDAKFVDQRNDLTDKMQKKIGENKLIFSKYMKIQEQINYKFQLSADGYATAWARIPWILSSNTLLFKPMSWQIQWFYNKLIPNQNFILLKDDLSDLLTKIKQLKSNDSRALRIIKNANAFAEEYLTAEAILDYGAQTLIKYANIQQLNLSEVEKSNIMSGKDIAIVLSQKRQLQLIEFDKIEYQKWERNSKLASFEATIEAFPFLKQNMNAITMIQKLKFHGISEIFLKVLIFQNKLYYEGKVINSQTKQSVRSFFKEILKNNQLPNIFILFLFQEQITQLLNQEKYQKILRQLPIFVISKNVSSSFQQTHLLFPSIAFYSKWNKTLQQQNNLQIKLNQKVNKAFYRKKLKSGVSLLKGSFNKKAQNIYKQCHAAGFTLLSHERPDLIDAKFIPSNTSKKDQIIEYMQKIYGIGNFFDLNGTTDQQFEYKYQLLDDDENSSWRLLSILFSSSIAMKTISQRIYFFEDKIIPNIHYVSINNNLSDLISKLYRLKRNETKYFQIQKNANILANNLVTVSGIQASVLNILLKYSQIQNFSIIKQLTKKALQKGESIQKVILDTKNEQELFYSENILNQSLLMFVLILMILCIGKVLKENRKKYKRLNIDKQLPVQNNQLSKQQN